MSFFSLSWTGSHRVATSMDQPADTTNNDDASIVIDSQEEANEDEPLQDANDAAHNAKRTLGSSSGNLYQSNLINNLLEYSPVIQGPKGNKEAAKLGTVLGVLLPCIQNIFGVIFFIRISWVVGNAGLLEGFLIAAICCLCTLLTSISLSAVATNGKISGGGPYFIISRNLSPQFGSSIGLLFYIGNTVAISMYVCGACEIFLKYMFQNRVSIMGDIAESSNFFWNVRFYGTIWLIVLASLVFIGVRFVSKVSPLVLVCVLLSILAVFTGIFKSAFTPVDLDMCVLGKRLLMTSAYRINGTDHCTKEKFCYIGNENETAPFVCPLYKLYCFDDNGFNTTCDPYWTKSELKVKKAFPGFPRAFTDNFYSGYLAAGYANPTEKGDLSKGQVIEQDTTTSFLILIGIFFPSVTGILAGCNRSGDLADPSRSIPKGTLTAQIGTSIVYLSALLAYGVSTDRLALCDKSGLGIDNKLVSAKLAWPHEWFVLIGSFFSTSGAALQSLISAPRLLHAISKDEVIPFLRVFSPTFRGEPAFCLLVTFFLAEIGVLAADIDQLTPLISMFFLICYTFINFTCALQSLMDTPNWRPRYKYYHWSLSILGSVICLSVMFIASPLFAVIAIVLAILIYIYTHFKGAEKEWGDGIQGFNLSSALYALSNLGDKDEIHVKNWRPQLLLFTKFNENNQVDNRSLFDFARQLKKGKGLTVVTNVIKGNYLESFKELAEKKKMLTELVKSFRLDGFSCVSVAESVYDGLAYQIQTSGIGQIRPNTVILGWPDRKANNIGEFEFTNLIKMASIYEKSVIILKCDNYPVNEKQEGTVDIWFILSDGGLMLQMGHLLNKHSVWRSCKLRLFTVAQPSDNSVKLKQELERCLHLLRLEAQVKVIEIDNEEMSAYAYEKTLRLMQRKALLKELNIPEMPLEISSSQMIFQPSKEGSKASDIFSAKRNDFTYTAAVGSMLRKNLDKEKTATIKTKVNKMHSAVHLNELIQSESSAAKLVIINLPSPPKANNATRATNYLDYIEALTLNIPRILLIHACGKEYITTMS